MDVPTAHCTLPRVAVVPIKPAAVHELPLLCR